MKRQAQCPRCRKVFKGRTLKSARSARDRHVREAHAGRAKSATAAAQRLKRNAVAIMLRRAKAAETERIPVAALVLCPLRRDNAVGYYAKTAEQLIGVGIENVTRFQGYDLHKDVKAAASCTSSQVVMKGFEDLFLTKAKQVFDKSPKTKFVLFAEDDMSFQSDISPADVLRALGDPRSPAASWLGCGLIH